MTMLRLLLVMLVTMRACTSDFPKCCDSDSVLRKTASGYNCTEDVDHRIEMVTNDTNFLQKEEEGFCVDIDDSVTLFKVNASEITREKELEVEFYRKCCPLNYVYSTVTHGCIKTQNLKVFFREKFVKVGLPSCKIIVDMKLDRQKHMELRNGSLVLKKENRVFGNDLNCVDRDEKQAYIARICYESYDVCDRIRCIHKCCPDGQSFVGGAFCRNTYIRGVDLSTLSAFVENVNDSFAIVHGYKPPVYALPNVTSYYISSEGTFMHEEQDESMGKIRIKRYYAVDRESYCIEHGLKKHFSRYSFFRSFAKYEPVKFIYTSIAMAISCICLVLTILYYLLSNEKRSLFGKILISYCFASLAVFFLVSFVTFMPFRPVTKMCSVVAFTIFYSTLAAFTWMNVMCIDIYWTFGSFKSFSNRQDKSKELKRFMLYSLYGWGFPLVLTGISLIFYHVRILPSQFQVEVDCKKWMVYRGPGNYATFIFSTIPMSLMELCNLVLFIITVNYCLKVKREVSRMNDTHVAKDDKNKKLMNFRDRFGLLMKLFLIMGISFLFEVVSTFYNFKSRNVTTIIEVVWDTFNSLQGLFIFLIFIVKKRIFLKVGKRVGLAKLRKLSLISSAMTQTTSVPTLTNSK